MSGGYFNDSDYVYYKVYQYADELENSIEKNNKPNEYGYSTDYSDEVIAFLKKKVNEIRKTADVMKAIDYLYSGDHGEDSFMKVVQNIESNKA